jgi:hypothetical protein
MHMDTRTRRNEHTLTQTQKNRSGTHAFIIMLHALGTYVHACMHVCMRMHVPARSQICARPHTHMRMQTRLTLILTLTPPSAHATVHVHRRTRTERFRRRRGAHTRVRMHAYLRTLTETTVRAWPRTNTGEHLRQVHACMREWMHARLHVRMLNNAAAPCTYA